MKFHINSWAWCDKSSLSELQINRIKSLLTVYPKQAKGFEKEDNEPILMFVETPTMLGVAREYALGLGGHEFSLDVSNGALHLWPGNLAFNGTLRGEQAAALEEIGGKFLNGGKLGGIVRASAGWGKTVFSCALIAKLGVPTLVVVHKEFLLDQWKERLKQYLPGVKVGLVQQDVCEYIGYHVVLAMVHTLASKEFSPQFLSWPGLVITDEVHRASARTWSVATHKFPSRWRLGISATPRRKDGTEAIFLNHIGPILFNASEQRMVPKVRRVLSTFQVVSRSSPPKAVLLNLLCASKQRNTLIVNQMVQALHAGRKLIVLSERLEHLNVLSSELLATWTKDLGPAPIVGFYVGGRKKAQLAEAAKANVIFATSQFASEGLDIPALDTLFLTTPLSDVEQAVGRITRPCEGKKDPIVVDFRDDHITMFKAQAAKREAYYAKVSAAKPQSLLTA